jgi:two-component system response regulator TctD
MLSVSFQFCRPRVSTGVRRDASASGVRNMGSRFGLHNEPRIFDMRILLVEDNKDLADWLQRSLRKEKYTVDWIDNGADADYVLRSESYNLVILDLALPKLDGKEVLRRLRSRNDNTPVLILTANNTIQSRVSELDHGADDYMAKPFEMEELEARMRVLLRRSSRVANPLVVCGDLQFDTNTREFVLAQKSLSLTPRERSVLEVLITKAGTTVSKQALADSLFSLDDDVSSDAIEIYVHRLRKKLEASAVSIVTLRGLGYLLREVPRVP